MGEAIAPPIVSLLLLPREGVVDDVRQDVRSRLAGHGCEALMQRRPAPLAPEDGWRRCDGDSRAGEDRAETRDQSLPRKCFHDPLDCRAASAAQRKHPAGRSTRPAVLRNARDWGP